MEFVAGPESRISSPPGVSKAELSIDFPDLLPLVELSPTILIYTRSSSHFNSVWLAPNCRASMQPRAIVRPRTDGEVSHILSLASAKHLPLTVRGGGHDSYGRSTLADGLVLCTRALDIMTLTADKKCVTIGGGVIAGKLLTFLSLHNVFVPMGYCSSVGYTGWALGGGFGVFTATYGAGADNITGARIVTANGRIIDTDNDPELLWGLRGAGNGNFGVVVEMRVRAFIPPPILGGWVAFPSSEAETVLGGFEKMCNEGMPVQFNGDIIVSRVPELGPLMMFMFVWTATDADLGQGYAHLEKIKGLGTLILDSVVKSKLYTVICFSLEDLCRLQNMVEWTWILKSANSSLPANPHDFLTLLNSTFKDFQGHPFYIKSPTMARYTSDFGRIIASNPIPDIGHVVGGTHNVHGVVEAPNSALVLPNRRHITLTLFGAVPSEYSSDGPEFKIVKDWVDKFAAEVETAGLGVKNGYVSFSPSNVDLESFYGQEDAKRLKALKRRLDPENLFFLAYPTLV